MSSNVPQRILELRAKWVTSSHVVLVAGGIIACTVVACEEPVGQFELAGVGLSDDPPLFGWEEELFC